MELHTERLEGLVLKRGQHNSPEDGLCFMEAVAYIRGLPHSDAPACVSPLIAAFGRNWNDGLRSDEERTHLLSPLILPVIGTAASAEVELRRSYLALDWLVREQVPAWCDLTESLRPHAAQLRALAPLTDPESCKAAIEAVQAASRGAAAAWAAAWAAARDAAWDAAGAAARDAAWAAARDAARDAAWAAAWDAAGAAARDAAWAAAGAAAGAAAWAAAGDAAGDAARDAARDAVEPTVKRLQESAVQLMHRMIECK